MRIQKIAWAISSFPAVFESQGYSHRAVTNLQRYSLVSSAFAKGTGSTVLAGWVFELLSVFTTMENYHGNLIDLEI